MNDFVEYFFVKMINFWNVAFFALPRGPTPVLAPLKLWDQSPISQKKMFITYLYINQHQLGVISAVSSDFLGNSTCLFNRKQFQDRLMTFSQACSPNILNFQRSSLSVPWFTASGLLWWPPDRSSIKATILFAPTKGRCGVTTLIGGKPCATFKK